MEALRACHPRNASVCCDAICLSTQPDLRLSLVLPSALGRVPIYRSHMESDTILEQTEGTGSGTSSISYLSCWIGICDDGSGQVRFAWVPGPFW